MGEAGVAMASHPTLGHPMIVLPTRPDRGVPGTRTGPNRENETIHAGTPLNMGNRMKRRPTTYLALGSVLLLAVAGCGQAKAGAAVPNGEDAATYVSAKFASAMDKLDQTLDQNNVKMSTDKYFRIDDKWIHAIIAGVRQGSPESRLYSNKSVKNPNEWREFFTPGEGAVSYQQLGPTYQSLAPTPWVSMPKAEAGFGPLCAFGGLLTACRMAQATGISVDANKKAIKGARSLADGKTELTAEVTVDAFLTARIEILPPTVAAKISDEMRKEVIATKLILEPDGRLNMITMEAKITKGEHTLELKYDFRFLGKAGTADLPPIPDPSKVTPLADQAAVDDFTRRLNEIQGN